ncbi:MAG: hypothetical protein ACHQ9S_14500 [Candidatus Binatia bacterium]
MTEAGQAWRTFPPALLVCLALAVVGPVGAVEVGPQGIVRQFCQADGLGKRVSVAGWDEVAPLVAWSFEPAWDHVVLIAGYEVRTPRGIENGGVGVEVRYTVIGEVSALGLDAVVHIETAELQLEAADGRWRIIGPPPPPHVFSHDVDVESMRQSLELGGVNFLPNTMFVWRMFQSAGWNVPFVPTTDLLSGVPYRAVNEPKVGDVVVYLRDGVPYHAGLLEARDQVVSSTLNAGIVRATTDAFAGEVKYLRLVQPEPRLDPTPVPSLSPAGGALPSSPARTQAARPRRTATPIVKREKQHSAKRPFARAQHSVGKRVERSKGRKPTKHPTPIARRKVP